MFFSSLLQIVYNYVGAGRRDKVGTFIVTMLSTLLVTALVFGSISYVFRAIFLRLMNTPVKAFDGTLEYSTVCIIGFMGIMQSAQSCGALGI